MTRLPDGYTRRRSRAITWLSVAGSAALVVSLALMPGPMDRPLAAENPYGLAGAADALIAVRSFGLAAIAAAIAGSLVLLFRRLAAARGDEREQLKWIVSSGASFSWVSSAFPGRLGSCCSPKTARTR